MTLVPLDIPAGFHGNGTDLEESNKWIDGSLVRWLDGSLRPIGGWRQRVDSVTSSTVRGMHSWQANDNTAWMACGSYRELKTINGGGDIYDITPDDLVAGREDGAAGTGYGNGRFGVGLFGVPIATEDDTIPLPATTWDITNFGEVMIACSVDDGTIWEWDLTTTIGSELVVTGDFATDTDWTKGVNWSISGGVAEYQQNIKTFDADDVAEIDYSTDTITITAHGFSDGDEVTYTAPAAPATAVGGLATATNYFVVGSTANTIQLAATSGGAAIDLTQNALTFDGDDATVVDVANDKIVDTNTFTTGDYVTYSNGGDVDIGGLTDGANYYIIAATASEFQLSLTSGGAAIDLTANNQVTIDSTDVAVVDTVNDKIITANTFSDGEIVTYSNGGGTDIGGLVDGTDYYIINASATEFQLSVTSGGAAVTITAVGVGAAHVFRQDIGSTHSFTVDHGAGHELARVNFGVLEQTVSGLVATPDKQDTHDVIVTLIDPDDDSDATTVPDVNVKVTGTTSTTVLVDQKLSVGTNRFRFGADDTEVKIEIVPNAYDTPNFDIDDISLRFYTVAEPVDNAPINNLGVHVTEERFIFALGSSNNPKQISWCDFEDRDTWTPSTTNQAGSQVLQTSGQIMCAAQGRGNTLIITDTDCHSATYVGPPYIYQFSRVGTHCGAVSRKSAVSTDRGVFWYGQENFFVYDGNTVSVLPCDVHDYVFGDFNTSQQSKVWGMVNGSHQEVWWFYPSNSATECDRYVAYDFMERHWLVGELSRTAGISRGVFAYPIMANKLTESTDLMDHEIGHNYDGSTVFAETGPIALGAGEQIVKVNSVIPDEKTQGDVQMTFKTRFHPNEADRSYGPFDPTNPTSLRFSGRQFRMRVEQDQAVDWRVGIMRLNTIAGGTR